MYFKQVFGNLICKTKIFYMLVLSSNTPQFNTKCYNSSNTKLLIDDIKLLEKLSLVNFENQKYVKVVEEAIEFANSINTVNTDEIEPLISLLEDR